MNVRIQRLGVMLRVHRYAKVLPALFRQIRFLSRGRRTFLGILADRPSAEVVSAIHRIHWPHSITCEIESAPDQVLSPDGERWRESLSFLHEMVCESKPDAILNLDDDQLFTRIGLGEIRGHLECLRADRYEYETRFLWDRDDQYNAAVPRHLSGNLFRVYPGDTFSKRFVAACPEACAQSGNSILLRTPVPNFGWLTQEQREEAWVRSKTAGRIDAFSLSLVRPPDLRDFKWE